MFKKIFIVYTSFSFLQMFLMSCGTHHCNAKFSGFSLDLIPTSKPSTTPIVPFDSLALHSSFWLEEYDCTKTNNFNLISSCYATSLYYDVTITERIDSVHFTTLRDYDSTHFAGSSINDILLHKAGFYAYEIFNKKSNELFPACEAIFQVAHEMGTSFNISSQLLEKPNNNLDTVEIAVTYYINNGTQLKSQTKPFMLSF